MPLRSLPNSLHLLSHHMYIRRLDPHPHRILRSLQSKKLLKAHAKKKDMANGIDKTQKKAEKATASCTVCKVRDRFFLQVLGQL